MLPNRDVLPYQPSDPVSFEFVDRRIAELVGTPRRAREIALLVWRRWLTTGDAAWLERIESIDRRLGESRDWREVAAYRAWRDAWLQDCVARAQRDVRVLTPQQRQSLRRSLATAERNVRRAGTADSAHLWRERAARYRQRLIDDCLVRWGAGRHATDSRLLRAARRARVEALALGWMP